MKRLLLEIGAEEIPAGYIRPALEALSEKLSRMLTDARIAFGSVQTFGTPRRLAIEIQGVAERQTPLKTEVTGPPARVGFDEEGRPTIAAQKFAEKVGLPVGKIGVTETPKGKYLYALKTEKGKNAKTVLKEILPGVILSLPFPKTMKWGTLAVEFARPIQTVLALLGDQVIGFAIGNIQSGRRVLGHPFMAPGLVKLPDADRYRETLNSAYVMPDMEERRAVIREKVGWLAADMNGKVLPDEELLDIVTNLVEYPVPVVGKFDEKFLELPQEILITAMREHQKYFAVVREDGSLMPFFIAVNNTEARDMGLVAKGHERVLRARLEDARFFYTSDVAGSMDAWVEKLKGVLFQAKLGSVYEKVKRVQSMASYLADAAGEGDSFRNQVSRAAWLCKADLVSQVVVEFPKLQGVMGRVYAEKGGEPAPVAAAIEEHYRPTHSGGALPETRAGALLALADKLDSICGCFSVGLVPTGASDPYALRRQGIGIVQIMLDQQLDFSLGEAIKKSVALFQEGTDVEAVAGSVHAFLRDRIAHILAEQGFQRDVIAAVTAVSIDHLPHVWKRVNALENLKKVPDFDPLAIAFKRVVNIIRKSEGFEARQVEPSLFAHESETALYQAAVDIGKRVAQHLTAGNFNQALLDIASMRTVVDNFFDGVLVMAEELELRNNRFALLTMVADLFAQIADFSRIST